MFTEGTADVLSLDWEIAITNTVRQNDGQRAWCRKYNTVHMRAGNTLGFDPIIELLQSGTWKDRSSGLKLNVTVSIDNVITIECLSAKDTSNIEWLTAISAEWSWPWPLN